MEEDIFLKNYPRLDLHGCDRDYARMLTNDFILENVLLKNKRIFFQTVLLSHHYFDLFLPSLSASFFVNTNQISFKRFRTTGFWFKPFCTAKNLPHRF